MRMLLTGLWTLASLTSLAHAEPRWCPIQPDSAYKMVFPAIARAAQVSGIVIARITYLPNGEVIQVESVAGPVMLKDFVTKQVRLWKIRTGAEGTSPCISLAIFDFSFNDVKQPPVIDLPVGILRMAIITDRPVPMESQAELKFNKKHWWSRK